MLQYDSNSTLVNPKYENEAFYNKSLTMYQTVTVTPNGLRPSKDVKESILANIFGAEEKYDTGDEDQRDTYWHWERDKEVIK